MHTFAKAGGESLPARICSSLCVTEDNQIMMGRTLLMQDPTSAPRIVAGSMTIIRSLHNTSVHQLFQLLAVHCTIILRQDIRLRLLGGFARCKAILHCRNIQLCALRRAHRHALLSLRARSRGSDAYTTQQAMRSSQHGYQSIRGRLPEGWRRMTLKEKFARAPPTMVTLLRATALLGWKSVSQRCVCFRSR